MRKKEKGEKGREKEERKEEKKEEKVRERVSKKVSEKVSEKESEKVREKEEWNLICIFFIQLLNSQGLEIIFLRHTLPIV
jgi:hypothetical protein